MKRTERGYFSFCINLSCVTSSLSYNINLFLTTLPPSSSLAMFPPSRNSNRPQINCAAPIFERGKTSFLKFKVSPVLSLVYHIVWGKITTNNSHKSSTRSLIIRYASKHAMRYRSFLVLNKRTFLKGEITIILQSCSNLNLRD